MPYWSCTNCHHEWEGCSDHCDWCDSEGQILEEETPLEKTNFSEILEKMKKK